MVLQKSFRCTENEIWHAKKVGDGRFTAPTLKKTEKAFRILNYYTVLEDGKLSDLVERQCYGRIDGYLGNFLPEIFAIFDSGRVPVLHGSQLFDLRKVVLEMAKRTPDFVREYDDLKTGREVVEATIEALQGAPENEETISALKDELRDAESLRAYGRDVRVRAIIGVSNDWDHILERYSVRWAVSEGRASFILSSLMAYRIGNGESNGLSNPKAEIWMPISPKIALVLVQDPAKRIPIKVQLDSQKIREINVFAMRNSHQIGSHSKRLLEALTGLSAINHRKQA